MGSNKSKSDSNRISKRSSPNNTIAVVGKDQIHIKESLTKPSSPERSFALANSYKNQSKKAQGNIYTAGN